jgi:hypothetical protein
MAACSASRVKDGLCVIEDLLVDGAPLRDRLGARPDAGSEQPGVQ